MVFSFSPHFSLNKPLKLSPYLPLSSPSDDGITRPVGEETPRGVRRIVVAAQAPQVELRSAHYLQSSAVFGKGNGECKEFFFLFFWGGVIYFTFNKFVGVLLAK